MRIEPVRTLSKAEIERAEARAREREIWGGVGGIVLFSLAIAALIVGVGGATFLQFRSSTPVDTERFEQCYASAAPNCVVDGDTIHIHDEKVLIAGIDAPRIQDSACPDERTKGIAAAVRLVALLNSGKVTASRESPDDYGRSVRTVKVRGEDVADTLIAEGLARRFDGTAIDWCSSDAEASQAS